MSLITGRGTLQIIGSKFVGCHSKIGPPKWSGRTAFGKNLAKIGPRTTFATNISLAGPILAAKTGLPIEYEFATIYS